MRRKKSIKKSAFSNCEPHFERYDYEWLEAKRPYLYPLDVSFYVRAKLMEENRCNGFEDENPNELLNSIKKEIKLRCKITKNEIFKVGELLNKAKLICAQHDIGYVEWIKESFDFSYETARNFIHVYRCCMGIRDVANNLPISVLYKICQPSFPDELRDYLLTQGNLENISNGYVDKIYKKYKEGGFTFDAISNDINEMDSKYNVFRQTHKYLAIAYEFLNELRALQSKLENPHSNAISDRFDNENPDQLQPESVKIKRMLFDSVRSVISAIEGAIDNSESILAVCEEEIKRIRQGE